MGSIMATFIGIKKKIICRTTPAHVSKSFPVLLKVDVTPCLRLAHLALQNQVI